MVSRRTVIASAVGVSTVAALAACAPQVVTETQSSTSPTPTPEASSVAGVEVCKTTDIPVGSGKRFDVEGVPILITQPTKGVFRGFSAVCTHAGFVMSTVANSEIKCDSHGSVFNADDGSVIKGQAQRALGKVTVEIQGDAVLVSF